VSETLSPEESSAERLMADYLDRRGFTYDREPDISRPLAQRSSLAPMASGLLSNQVAGAR
jgi:hypothetical protein